MRWKEPLLLSFSVICQDDTRWLTHLKWFFLSCSSIWIRCDHWITILRVSERLLVTCARTKLRRTHLHIKLGCNFRSLLNVYTVLYRYFCSFIGSTTFYTNNTFVGVECLWKIAFSHKFKGWCPVFISTTDFNLAHTSSSVWVDALNNKIIEEIGRSSNHRGCLSLECTFRLHSFLLTVGCANSGAICLGGEA